MKSQISVKPNNVPSGRRFPGRGPAPLVLHVADHVDCEIKKIFAADPLVCPDCGGAMRIIAFIEDPRVIRAILVYLSLWEEARPPPIMPGGAPREPAELEYLPWEE